MNGAAIQPLRVLLVIGGSIFIVEVILMYVIDARLRLTSPWLRNFGDALVLTAVASILIWLGSVRPMRVMLANARRIAEELQHTRDRLLRVLQNSPAVIWSARIDADGRIPFYISDNVSAQLGYTPQAFLEDRSFWLEHIHPDDVDTVAAAEPGLLAAGFGSRDYRFLHYDGSWRWIREDVNVVPSGNGTVKELVGHWLDVTERYVAARERDEANARYRATLDSALDAIVISDHAGRIIYLNSAAEQTFGYAGDTAVGKPLAELLMPDAHDGVFRDMWTSDPKDGVPAYRGQRLELSLRHARGHLVPVELTAQCVAYGTTFLLTLFARDVSEQKQAQQALLDTQAELIRKNEQLDHANRVKSEFLAAVSHELRTPLNAVIGFAELFASKPEGLDAERLQYVDEIRCAGEHLLKLVDAMLEMNRLDAEDLKAEAQSIDVVDTLHQAVEAHRADAAKRGIEMRLQVPAHTAEMRISPRALRSMLDHLISNAIKFNRCGGRVDLSCDIGTTVPDGVEIAVADTGIGIAQEDQARIFDVFTQADSSLARNYGGLGMGLALLKRLVHLCGGTIALESAPAKGSRFILRLPRAPGAETLN